VSIEETQRSPDALPASHYIAGFLAAAAIFAGIVGIVYYPGRVAAGAILVALVAAAMGGFQSRLAGFAVAIATACWLAGMIISVIFERPVF
jgi:hypothetical protein